ncbi:exo-beta-N-acetylmuramidase NamZ family protein [Mangrovibacterium diazotrophicum]|uniref:Uncharacterized protein YbbC (DUF1343 family) n=1 Tax=Mangrovibacterium diazotrophicum TaxID=1261403 RepID=A0A419W9W8_9BACT|nr:DUF1343 domain-containing protein [Mangrovibacterium diazotrophicum]RKD92202.1 uncharacterized protein YbbC (DUF1343 family) [Mangrovibacterium diazotrophicum]
MYAKLSLISCLILLASILTTGCSNSTEQSEPAVIVGADRSEIYLPLLENKNVGLVVNQTSMVDSVHLIDYLYRKGVNIKAIYAPEHGYKGTVERGKHVDGTTDPDTGVPVYSLYGKNRKPGPEMLEGVDVVVFDIQDVGVRFFTYISTLNKVMEACAENGIKVIVLDRPNPLGYYVDGPVLDSQFGSFVGLNPIPVIHGLTVGEYAQMANGEGWLKDSIQCDLEVVKVENYTHATKYQLPILPSPNLPDMKSIYLYPSICLFEGANVNEGRGTYKPFQQFGAPYYTPTDFSYVPKSIPVLALHPKFEGDTCYGYDLSGVALSQLQEIRQLEIKYVIDFYNKCDDKENFFISFFDTLAGTDQLRKQIIEGQSEEQIRASWQQDLDKYKQMRKKYLLYDEN